MRFASLGSGSKGNCTIVECKSTNILVDCGFSLRNVCARLEQLEKSPEDLTAILLSHEHSDHWKGVEDLASKFDIPVYLSAGTHKVIAIRNKCTRFNVIRNHQDFVIGDLKITPVPMPHDAREPIQFIFRNGALRFGIITDLGHFTRHIVDSYSMCNGILLESNYDEDMLLEGRYPEFLKQRVSGLFGHLSNSQARDLILEFDRSCLKHVLIGHVSEKNNDHARIKDHLDILSLDDIPLQIASQDEVSGWFNLS